LTAWSAALAQNAERLFEQAFRPHLFSGAARPQPGWLKYSLCPFCSFLRFSGKADGALTQNQLKLRGSALRQKGYTHISSEILSKNYF